METLIPAIAFILTLMAGLAVIVGGVLALGTKEKGGSKIVLGIIIIIVSLVLLYNIPVQGPYFEKPVPGKIYLLEGTIKLDDKYVTALIEWSPSTKAVIPHAEIFNSSKEELGFRAGDCVNLQGGELRKIIIQGCGNNS
ncbi:MAG: hypothetical protein WC788_07880 [Candidatus Paceibacterota bacterium]|jgi:hypothetical protein